jgi:ABC-type multidrug transport system fused ATPase/permease subunit
VTVNQTVRLRSGPLLRPYRRPLALAIALAMADVVVGLARPWPVKIAVDNVIGGHELTGWLAGAAAWTPASVAAAAAAAGVVLVALSGLLDYLSTYLSDATAERVGADLRQSLMDRLVGLSLRFHDRNRSGDLVSRVTGDVSRVQDALVALLAVLVPELLTLAGMLVIMLLLDSVLALAALAVVPLLAVVVVRRRRRVRDAQRRARDFDGQLANKAVDIVRNVRAVQVFGQERASTRDFRDRNIEATSAALDTVELEARYAPLADIVLATGSGFVLWLGVVRVTGGHITTGELLVFLSYLGSLYGPVRSLSRLATTLARGASSRDRIAEVLFSTEHVVEAHDAVVAPALTHALELDGLCFAYPGGASVLHDLSLRVEAGERLCIVGPTGVGKTTLLNLLLRLYDPDVGSISIDGVDIRRCTLTSLRERIAYVPQDPWLLDGTLAENIAFGQTGATEHEIRHAAHDAVVDEFVATFPQGYDTPVGESGVFLSGGQRRRIAIARAILRDADLILLDEPTSGLDPRAAARVMQAIDRAADGRTVIVVTHQLELALDSARVVVFEGGRIVEDGAPLDLIATDDGPFALLAGTANGRG